MNKQYRSGFIAITFGVVVTIIIAVINHGGVAAMKTGKFWGEIAYVLLLAGILTGILYAFMDYRKKEAKKKKAKESKQGNRAVKRSRNSGQRSGMSSQKKKKKKK